VRCCPRGARAAQGPLAQPCEQCLTEHCRRLGSARAASSGSWLAASFMRVRWLSWAGIGLCRLVRLLVRPCIEEEACAGRRASFVPIMGWRSDFFRAHYKREAGMECRRPSVKCPRESESSSFANPSFTGGVACHAAAVLAPSPSQAPAQIYPLSLCCKKNLTGSCCTHCCTQRCFAAPRPRRGRGLLAVHATHTTEQHRVWGTVRQHWLLDTCAPTQCCRWHPGISLCCRRPASQSARSRLAARPSAAARGLLSWRPAGRSG